MSKEGRKNQFLPKLLLYNAYGYTNLQKSIENAIEQNVDVILYSQVWEYGGNFDGKGFINALISRATNAGILWVNAAGDFSGYHYRSSIDVGDESWVKLPDQNSGLRLECRSARYSLSKCQARIVLSWNDVDDDVNIGTDKDLDLVIVDDLLNIKSVASRKQTSKENEPNTSRYPFEIIEVTLDPGVYFLRVKAQSENFFSEDKLFLWISGTDLIFPQGKSFSAESISVGADHPNVLTIGALDSPISSMSKRLYKPEILAPSLLQTYSGVSMMGTSNAAAIVAAGLALLRSVDYEGDREDILSKIERFGQRETRRQTSPGYVFSLLAF
jgi:hypothetical protein